MPKRDERVAYGAKCTWWGSIYDVEVTDTGKFKLPCCPHCHGMLMEVESEKVWWRNVENYIRDQNQAPAYRDFVLWLRNRCFASMGLAIAVYELEDESDVRNRSNVQPSDGEPTPGPSGIHQSSD